MKKILTFFLLFSGSVFSQTDSSYKKNYAKNFMKDYYKRHEYSYYPDLFYNESNIHPDSVYNLSVSLKDFNGELPKQIYTFKNLVSLDVSGLNDSTRIDTGILKLKKLKILKIGGYANARKEFPDIIFNLPNLEELQIRNFMSGHIDFRKAKFLKLKKLFIDKCFLYDLKGIEKLKGLETLQIIDVQFDHIPKGIMKCTNLKKLELTSNYYFYPVSKNPKRRIINSVPKSINSLSKLEYLLLPVCGIQNIQLDPKKLTNLKVIELWGNDLSSESMKKLKADFPKANFR